MTRSIKQRIAREWLILLACIIIGLVIGLTVICSDFYAWLRPPSSDGLSEYEVFGTKQLPAFIFYERRQLWLYVLLLYLAVMLVRSLVWSVKMLRSH